MSTVAPPPVSLQGSYLTAEGARSVVVCAADDGTWAVVDLEGPRHGWLAERVPSLREAYGVLEAYITDAGEFGRPLSPLRVTAFDLGVDRIRPTAKHEAIDETWPITEAEDLEPRPRVIRTQKGRGIGRAALRAPAAPKRSRKTPLPHQDEALADVAAALRRGERRASVLMACGSGKTLVEMWAAQAHAPAGRVTVFVPSLALMAQTITEWRANSPVAFELLGVCSDDTVADPEHEQAGVEAVARVAPVTSDPQTIAEFFADTTQTLKVAFCTYHSADRVVAAQRAGAPDLNLIVCDEAHRAAGDPDGMFSLVCDADNGLRTDVRLFFTATQRPRMADLDRFGPVVHRLSFGGAIKRGLLCDYRIVVGACTTDDALALAVRRQPGLIGTHSTDARTVAAQAAMLDAMDRYGARRALTFHNYIATSEQFAETLPAVNAARGSHKTIETHHVCGLMPTATRAKHVDRLRGTQDGKVIVSSARCLGEGVDVPAVDMVAIIDPRDSAVDIAQIIGRALRPSPGKALATVFIAAIVDGDPQEALELEALSTGPFATVARTLEVLSAHDERIAARLRAGADLKRPWFARGDHHEDAIVVGPADLTDRFVQASQARLVERIVGSWERRYDALVQFIAREKHACVPHGHREGGMPLGAWVASQRALYRDDRLDAERVAALEALPGWAWWVYDSQWETAYGALLRFIEREGHALVPFAHREGPVGLGSWVAAQRTAFRKGNLASERRLRLEQLEHWQWHPVDARFMQSFLALRAFIAEHGHCDLPRGYTRDGIKLGSWLRRQRAVYGRGQLAADRIRLLETLPCFSWEPSRDAWNRNFALLERYVDEHGDGRVPAKYVIDGVPLGIWVSTQRMRFRDGAMLAERVSRLESIPGWAWNARDAQFDQHLAALKLFVEREGHATPRPTHVEDGVKLGVWADRQRQRYAAGKLEARRVAALEVLPGWRWE